MGFFQDIDQKFFLFLNGLHTSFLDPLMWQISGRIIWIPLYALIIFFMMRQRKWNGWVTLLAIVLMIILSDQLSDLVKDSVQRLRPTHNPMIENLVHVIKDPHGHDYRGGSYGFVSSHACNSFAVAVFVSLFFRRRWVTIGMFSWALLVCYSRIYLGVHYPLDILGGAVLGSAIGLLMVKAERWAYVKIVATKAQQQRKSSA
jgi:undecaprenyl-diphosphatase